MTARENRVQAALLPRERVHEDVGAQHRVQHNEERRPEIEECRKLEPIAPAAIAIPIRDQSGMICLP